MRVRRIAAFSGTARCRRQAGAINLSLVGAERAAGGAGLAVLFAGAGSVPGGAPLSLPETLPDACVDELEGSDGVARWRIRWSGGEPGGERIADSDGDGDGSAAPGTQQLELAARSVHVHRDVGRRFFEAVPPARAAPAARAGWSVLFALLRLPGVACVLRRSAAWRAR